MLGGNFTKPLQVTLFRKFRSEITNIPDDLDMGEMGMSRAGLKEGVVWKLHNETDHGFPQECVGYCDKVGREMVLRSALMEGNKMVHTIPLY